MEGAVISLEDRVRALPCWKGGIAIEPLSGGLSNANFLVRDAGGKHVVRLGKDFPFHHVARDRELMNARAAQAGGFAPAVEYAGDGAIVFQHIEGKTFAAEDIRANYLRIAALMRAFHREMPHHVSGAGFMFWVFHVVRDYARSLRAGGSRMTSELPGYLALADELSVVRTFGANGGLS